MSVARVNIRGYRNGHRERQVSCGAGDKLAEIIYWGEDVSQRVTPPGKRFYLLPFDLVINVKDPKIVKDLDKREQDLSRRIKDMETRAEKAEVAITTLNKESQKLLDIGLSPEALAEFSQRVQSIAHHHNIAPTEIRGRLLLELESLDKGLGLEALSRLTRQQELEKQERAAAAARQDSDMFLPTIGLT